VKTLLAYEGVLRLSGCCAKPQNRVRKASVTDVVEWIDDNDAWEAIQAQAPDATPPAA